MQAGILALIEERGVVLGDGGYLIELERRGYVDSGSGREKVGTGRGSGQFTPEVAIEHPDALRQLHLEFLRAGSQVLQALTFFGTREKLKRAGYDAETEVINQNAVRIARQAAAGANLVGANCEQEPKRMLAVLREMRAAVDVPLAAQPAAFRSTDETPCFTASPSSPMNWRPFKCRGKNSPASAASRRTRALFMSAAVAGATPRIFAPWRAEFMTRPIEPGLREVSARGKNLRRC